MSTISPQTALIYAMVIAAVADEKLKDSEIEAISFAVRSLPAFRGYTLDAMRTATGDCVALLDDEDGIEAALGLVKEALPPELTETAYALACDIVAVDGNAEQSELRWLEMLRHELNVERLHAAAIERGARARYRRWPKDLLTGIKPDKSA
ncbi:tellurite resistance TerB family protein [Ferrovibrio sp.]|uniref:tellurite resistance TerB family protein n=1 Tax=Ferrovibrio sp. TaxID=1917215 RepID=UPI0025B8A2BD|nr:tellurite resistance TerB family protein [Ferrovibrio sp.]MBX3454847.1 tellurite resistance TerB family protein [Ferrovibrio sp.]